MPAQDLIRVIYLLMADLVTSADPAQAQTGVNVPQAADTVLPAALGPIAPAVLLYECRHCKDHFPGTAFGSHANGQQHVRCRACYVSISH